MTLPQCPQYGRLILLPPDHVTKQHCFFEAEKRTGGITVRAKSLAIYQAFENQAIHYPSSGKKRQKKKQPK